jgi:hypothetical protein
VPEPEVGVPGPLLPDPEHAPLTLGLHVKPAPQSESRLHGNCHRYAHALVVVVVQVGSITTGGPASQGASGAQGATAAPPEHALEVCVAQTRPSPQSVSTLQDFGSQVVTTVGVAEASGFAHATPGGHAGSVELTVELWQA